MYYIWFHYKNGILLVTSIMNTVAKWGSEPLLMLGVHCGILSLNGLKIAVLVKC